MSNILRQRLEAGQSVYAEHPAADTLAAFIEHSLKNTERDKVLSHLSACSECRQAVLLAVPEVAEALRVQAPHSSPWYFPTAMRWASLTAAAAVAVGAGMIAYEHEFGARSSNPPSVEPEKIATAQREVANEQRSETAAAPRSQTTLQDSLSKDQSKRAVVREPHEAELKRAAPAAAPSRKNTDKALEMDQRAEARNVTPALMGGMVSAKERSSGKDEVGLAKQQNQAAASIANGGPIQQPSIVSQNETVTVEAMAPVATAAPPPASPAPSARKADTSHSAGNSAEQAKREDSSIAQTVTSESAPGYFDAKTAMPAKMPGFTALNGSMKKSAAAVTEFASWTVTTAGKLQRRLRDGAVNFIEPAPGLIVRAVAARGIEVWAGGSEPDAPKQGPQSALFHSSDAGESWKQVNGPWHGPINQLALSGPDTLTVVTDDGTWVSKDAGGSWTNR